MKTIAQKYPIVALIGRTNVGKSTIFNCLTHSRKALVSKIPGTTRDRRYSECDWDGQMIVLTDTAGIDANTEQLIDRESVKQTRVAMQEADVILFVVDGREGLLLPDKDFAKEIKKTGKPTILVVNKVDSEKYFRQIAEFYKLGFKEVFPLSAKSGSGTGDMLDAVIRIINEKIPQKKIVAEYNVGNEDTKDDTDDDDSIETIHDASRLPEIKISIVGKPNVGKSSLLNSILGEQRAIVSPVPHTTRESQDVTVEWLSDNKIKMQKTKKQLTRNLENLPEGETESKPTPSNYLLTFVDTAGIIKRRKIHDALQKDSIFQSLTSIRRSDIVLLVIDASEPITTQDKNISHAILDEDKSVIFVVNKWDTIKNKTTDSDKEYIRFLHGDFPYLTWVPIVFTSAIKEEKPTRLVDLIIEMYNSQHQTITQAHLDKFLKHLVRKRLPQKSGGTEPPFIYKIKQLSSAPLVFEIVTDQVLNISFSYQRYIQNELRKYFDFIGCGIKIRITNNSDKAQKR